MLEATADQYELDGVEQFASSQVVRRLIDPTAETIAIRCWLEGMVCNGSIVSAGGDISS
jgi:hypothetical protein